MEISILLLLLVAVILIPAIRQYRREMALQRVLLRLEAPKRRLPQ